MEMLRVGKFAKLVGVHPLTVRRWIYDGKIKAVKVGKEYRIPYSEYLRLTGNKDIRNKVVIYARVSSKDQEKDLQIQVEYLKKYCEEKGYEVIDVLTDIASGLNENRKGLNKLFDYVINKEISKVIIATEDRLTRFGFRYLSKLFKAFDVEIEVVDKKKFKTPQGELVEDLITIITSFAGRLYGFRSHKRRKVIEGVRNLLSS